MSVVLETSALPGRPISTMVRSNYTKAQPSLTLAYSKCYHISGPYIGF